MKSMYPRRLLCRSLVLSTLLVGCSSSSEPATKAGTKAAQAESPSPHKSDSITAKPGSSSPKAKPPAMDAPGQETDIAAALYPASGLQWKRHAAIEADLSRALELPAEALCQEFGRQSCTRTVHLVPLGGNEPFNSGMFEPPAEPLATTPTVVDRVVLTACANRVSLDREAGDAAQVFSQFSLAAEAPAPSDPAAQAMVTDLFQRLLGRDPEQDELELVATLARDDTDAPVAATDFAKLACYTVGTSAEFLFF